MDSRLSGLELCVSIRRENIRREKKLKKKKRKFYFNGFMLKWIRIMREY